MKKRIHEYDVLKVIAIILVIISHSTYYKITSGYGGIDYQQYLSSRVSIIEYKLFDKLREILYYFHMPMFMAISGAFYYIQVKNNRWTSISEFVRNKSKRLLVPFIIFTLLYTLPVKYLSDYFEGITVIRAISGQVFLLGNSHLWYLYALFVIFIIGFYMLKENMNLLMIGIIYILHVISYLINITIVSAPLQFLFWFSLGFLFESKRIEYNKFIIIRKKSRYFIIALFIVLVGLNMYVKHDFTILSKILVDIMAVLGSAIFYNLALILKDTKIVSLKLYNYILINGLGIYIFSDTLNYLILKISYSLDNYFMFTPIGIVILVIVRVILTLFVSLMMVIVFKKIFKRYYWLVN